MLDNYLQGYANQDNLFNYKTQLEEIEDILKYSIIKSPIAGYVYEINAKDKGFVIAANQDILKIVPQENLEALVFVNSKDIGFILTGQEVELNIDSYPAADFGGVDGIISFISANSRKINDRDMESIWNEFRKCRIYLVIR